MVDLHKPPFSIRTGVRKLPVLGMQDMPHSLRIGLWNTFEPWIWAGTMYTDVELPRRINWVYSFHATNWPTDEAWDGARATKRLKPWFLETATWDNVYDFVEALPDMVMYGLHSEDLDRYRNENRVGHEYAVRQISTYTSDLNRILAREDAPYRYQDGKLLPITNEHELTEISRAVGRLPYIDAREHIETAAQLLSARPEPDYRNSIKESISAVESLLWETTGQKGAKMPALLDAFEKAYNVDLHEAFKGALIKLYGWTSDDSGVRHAIFGEVTVAQTEARFMLVACSALVNFLSQKTIEAGK